MATNLRNCRGTSHDGKGKEEHNCSKKENDGGEADDDGIIVDDDQGDAVIIPAAAYKKDGGGVDAPRKESFSSEIYCPEDFFIDEFNCGSYRDIDTELADETFCIDGFDERAASRIARTNVSAPEENNIDVQYEGRMVQDNDADPSFNAEKAPPPHPRMLYIIPSISSFAILGCLARIYTDILFHNRLGVTTTGSTLVVLSFYSNLLGTMILGFMKGLHSHSAMSYIIEVGIGTGFCGCYTTFSSWEMEFALQLKEGEILETLTRLISSAALFTMSYVLGVDLAAFLMSSKKVENWWKRSIVYDDQATVACIVAFCSFVPLLVLLVVLDDSNFTRRAGWLSSLFAPFGALGRYFIGKALNHSCHGGRFPLGTFCSNIVAAASLALVEHSSPKTSCGQLFHEAFIHGLLASLSTMSSFLSEVISLRHLFGNIYSYTYFIASIIFGTIVSGILGPVWIWD